MSVLIHPDVESLSVLGLGFRDATGFSARGWGGRRKMFS